MESADRAKINNSVMNEKTLLTVRDLNVKFATGIALKNVSFAIEKGDFLGIIGPNGSGKTVLVRTVLGMVPYSGVIEWASHVRMGYVPQHIDLDRHLSLTLGDFLSLKAKIVGALPESIPDILRQVGLSEAMLKIRLQLLSGGQLQRGMIAFSLIGKPDIIFFDEPTASVDSPAEEKIYQTLHRLQDEYGLTVVLVSHELETVAKYANKILCLNREMICFGDAEASLKPEVIEKLYASPAHPHAHH